MLKASPLVKDRPMSPKPCPFCGIHLTPVTLDMRYASDTACQHPPTGCVLDGLNVFGKQTPLWNRRTNDGIERLLALNAEMLAALEGVVRVADRKTIEFDAARTAIARTGK